MGAITDRLTDTRARLGEQGGAFIRQTKGAGSDLVSRTKEAGETFLHETVGAGEAFLSNTREAGADLISVMQSEAEAWLEVLRSQNLMGRDLRLHFSTEELEQRVLEKVRDALTAVGEQVELVLETQVEARLKESSQPKRLPKAKAAGAAKAAKANGNGKEPFKGYEELSAKEVVARIGRLTEDKAEAILAYEKAHKARATVLRAAELRIAES